MSEARQQQVERILASIERQLRDRPDRGVLDPDTVLALDIIQHALSFISPADALALWREALWRRKIAEGARDAVRRMLEHILAATERGEPDAAAKICNCLQAVTNPRIFHGSTADPTASNQP